MKKSILFLALMVSLSGCCYSQLVNQLPDQIYFANDSCEYYLPDYTEAITVSDNCNIDYFYQYPESGAVITAGVVTEVSIVAGDVSGNEKTIHFNVLLVDTIPPEFHVDTILFNSLSQYQNEYRTWHLYNWVTSKGDTLKSPNAFGFWGYYTATELLSIQDPKCHPPTSTFVAYEDLPDGHPLKPLPGPEPIFKAFNKCVDTTGIHFNHFRSPMYYKRQVFFVADTYRISYVMLPLMRVGSPENLLVDLFELDENDVPIRKISIGATAVDSVSTEMEWDYIVMSDAIVLPGKYCLEMSAEGVDNENYIGIGTNNDPSPEQYLMYSYTAKVDWGYNYEADYMYQIMGYTVIN